MVCFAISLLFVFFSINYSNPTGIELSPRQLGQLASSISKYGLRLHPLPAHDPTIGKSQHFKLDSRIVRTIAILPVLMFSYILFFTELSFQTADGYAFMKAVVPYRVEQRPVSRARGYISSTMSQETSCTPDILVGAGQTHN